jgi:hypothetical protein
MINRLFGPMSKSDTDSEKTIIENKKTISSASFENKTISSLPENLTINKLESANEELANKLNQELQKNQVWDHFF